MSNPITSRHEFLFIFDVENGNPNGDPNDSRPRMDDETGIGFVTDVCIKRKIRNFVSVAKEGKPPFDIYAKQGGVMETTQNQHEPKGEKDDKKKKAGMVENLCWHYYDVRAFGAVITKAPSVTGPIQLTFSNSVDPINIHENAISASFVQSEKQAEDKERNQTLGEKYTVPYGLYVGKGFINPHHAAKTGFDADDLALFWEAMTKMFWGDRSASRGHMEMRGLYAFKHASPLGDAAPAELFSLISVKRKDGVEFPRSFDDYTVTVNENTPSGVELLRIVA